MVRLEGLEELPDTRYGMPDARYQIPDIGIGFRYPNPNRYRDKLGDRDTSSTNGVGGLEGLSRYRVRALVGILVQVV